MPIVFSRHALAQIRERNLTRRDIENAVRVPLRVIEQGSNRYRAVRIIRRRQKRHLLVVIYDQRESTSEIVTAFLTSKFKKYL